MKHQQLALFEPHSLPVEPEPMPAGFRTAPDFIGAEPNTDWLASSGAKLDAKGFLLTGADARAGGHILETSLPGVFAIGDARSGSVKRVAAAVGEGAQVVAQLHAYLADRAPFIEERS